MKFLYQNLRFLEIEEDDTVFKYGDEGNLFYIIMEGEVIVKTPSPDELDEEYVTPEGFLLYMVEYYRDIEWSVLNNGTQA